MNPWGAGGASEYTDAQYSPVFASVAKQSSGAASRVYGISELAPPGLGRVASLAVTAWVRTMDVQAAVVVSSLRPGIFPRPQRPAGAAGSNRGEAGRPRRRHRERSEAIRS